jgi:hypothetical protein
VRERKKGRVTGKLRSQGYIWRGNSTNKIQTKQHLLIKNDMM